MEVAWLTRTPARRKQMGLRRLESILQLIDSTTDAVQHIAEALRPPVLDELGLRAAIEWEAQKFQSHSGIECELRLTRSELRLNDEQATTIFRILQEALTN